MSKVELVNWFLFALGALSAAVIYVAYGKSSEIIRHGRKGALANTPDQYKLAHETVEFSTADGVRLKGWFLPAPGGESGRTIIFCHGWRANRGEMLRDTAPTPPRRWACSALPWAVRWPSTRPPSTRN
jgi:hypothetical protein